MCDYFWEKTGLSAGEGDLSDVIRAAQPSVHPEPPSMWHLPVCPSASADQGSSSSGGFGDPFSGTESAPFEEMPDKELFDEIKGIQYDLRVCPVIACDDVAKNIGVASEPTITPLRAQGTKRSMHRKGQTKKVVCIPALVAAPGSSAPTAIGRPTNGSEVVPSDLWAWRKYGQKPIKGSPYPRGYYRCSSSKGCSARKQVERSRTDPSMLVITYTSEHNHPWPTHRNTLAGSSRGGHLSKSLCLNPANHNLTPTLLPQVSMQDELNKMTNMLKMSNEMLFKQELMEGRAEGLFWGISEVENDPVTLIISNRESTQEKQGEKSKEKVIDPFSMFK